MDFQVLQDAAVALGNPERASGHLLALFLQSDGSERAALRRARAVEAMLEARLRTPALPKNLVKVVAGQKVSMNPALSKEKGYTSLAQFVRAYDAWFQSKDALAGARRAQLFKPFLVDLNAKRLEYLARDEHCFVQYDDDLHLFRCFGGAVEPDEVAVQGLARLDDFPDLPPRTAPVPARLLPPDARPTVSDLVSGRPTRATALEDLDAWLRAYGYDPDALAKEDGASLAAVLKANVAAELVRLKAAPVPGAKASGAKKEAPRDEHWYEAFVRETRAPDVGRVALLRAAAEQRQHAKPGAGAFKPPALPEAPTPADVPLGDDAPHSTNDLYANVDKYEEHAAVTLSRFDGRPTYVLKQGVWRRTFEPPVVDRHAAARVAAQVAAQAAADRDKTARNPDADAATFDAWARLRGRLDVYRADGAAWVAQEAGAIVVAAQEADDTYDEADNPLFYKPIDPFGDDADAAPPDSVEPLVDASHLRLTQQGRAWLRDNLEFYNSEQAFRARQRRETDKLAATLQALEQSSEWIAASDAKQREMRERVRRIGDERLSKAAKEFRDKQALVGAALLSLAMSAESPAAWLDGAPELHPLCVPDAPKKPKHTPPQGPLEQAQAYLVCAFQRARLLDARDDAPAAVREYVDAILRDKPDLKQAKEAPWKAAPPPSAGDRSPLLALPSPHASAPTAAALLEPCGRDARPNVLSENDARLHTRKRLERPAAPPAPEAPDTARSRTKDSLLGALGDEPPQDVLQRAKQALQDLQVPGAASLPALTDRHSTLSAFVRSEFLSLLCRIARGYKADTTAFRKKYLAPDVQRAVEDAVASENGVLQRFASEDAETFRKHAQRIVDGAVLRTDGSPVASFAALVLAVRNIPAKDGAYAASAMVAPSGGDDLRAEKTALLTHVLQRLAAAVRFAHSDIDALRTTKVDAREKRDAGVRARYESMDPDLKQTIGLLRKMNFKDWKEFVSDGDGDGLTIQADAAPEASEEPEEEASDAEAEDEN
jgi:hypothetical protein